MKGNRIISILIVLVMLMSICIPMALSSETEYAENTTESTAESTISIDDGNDLPKEESTDDEEEHIVEIAQAEEKEPAKEEVPTEKENPVAEKSAEEEKPEEKEEPEEKEKPEDDKEEPAEVAKPEEVEQSSEEEITVERNASAVESEPSLEQLPADKDSHFVDEDVQQEIIPALEQVPEASEFEVLGSTLLKYVGSSVEVIIPDGISEIGEKAFKDNMTVEVVQLSDSVETIGAYAFSGCANLIEIRISEQSHLSCVKDYAFENCRKLKAGFGNSVIDISENAFWGTKIILNDEDKKDGKGNTISAKENEVNDDSNQEQESVQTHESQEINEENDYKIVAKKDEVSLVGRSLLTSGPAIVITAQPETIIGEIGEPGKFTVKAENVVSYQWETRQKGAASWSNTSREGYKTDTLTIVAVTGSLLDYEYRCKLTGLDGKPEYTEAAGFALPEGAGTIEITTEPEDIIGLDGEDGVFQVVATGVETYEWQTRIVGTTNWNNTSRPGYDGPALSILPVTKAVRDYEYRCKLKDGNGGVCYTKTVGFKYPAFLLVQNPEPYEGDEGDSFEFSVVAENVASYQWETRKTGEAWHNTARTGNDSATLTIDELTDALCDYEYRCAMKDYDGNTNYSASVGIRMIHFVDNDVKYTIVEKDKKVIIEKYLGNAEMLTIPELLRGKYIVIEVGSKAFEGNTSLRVIDLPDTIEVIGERGFADCTNLTTMK